MRARPRKCGGIGPLIWGISRRKPYGADIELFLLHVFFASCISFCYTLAIGELGCCCSSKAKKPVRLSPLRRAGEGDCPWMFLKYIHLQVSRASQESCCK